MKTELEILIKTVLEGRGITATKDELRGLTQELERGAVAGEQINTSGAAIEDTLKKLRGSAKETASAWEQMTDAQKADQRELAQRQVRLLQNEEAQKRAADASKLLSKELGALRLAGQGLNNVFNGLSQGGISGMIQAGRGLVDVTRAASAGVGVLTRALAIAAPAAAAAGVAIAAMNKASDDNAKQMAKMWQDAEAGAEAYRKTFAALTAQIETDAARQRNAIEGIIAAYDRLQAESAKADRRAAERFAAEKQLALAQATTPEERAAVEARFEGAARDNTRLNANLDQRQAEEYLANLSAEAHENEAVAREAQTAADRAADNAALYGNSSSPDAIAARKAALAARDAAKVAREKANESATRIAEQMNRAYDTIGAAGDTREIVGLQTQTAAAQARSSTPAPTVAPTGPKFDRAAAEAKIGTLRSTAESAMLNRDYAAQDAAVAELKTLRAALAAKDAAVTDFAKKATADANKTKEQIKNAKANTTGGG